MEHFACPLAGHDWQPPRRPTCCCYTTRKLTVIIARVGFLITFDVPIHRMNPSNVRSRKQSERSKRQFNASLGAGIRGSDCDGSRMLTGNRAIISSNSVLMQSRMQNVWRHWMNTRIARNEKRKQFSLNGEQGN